MTTTVPLLAIRDLTVEFATRNGTVEAVRAVDLRVMKGETMGIVGESGSGKSVTSYAVMRILDRAGRIAAGTVTFGGVALHDAQERAMRAIRGREISMIFQNPRAALNPIRRVGRQIEDVLIEQAQATRADARAKAIDMLRLVRIPEPEARYDAYPFELSGGMCQRIVIAIALACRPQLLIADEPTTGLDVTTQKAVMDLVVELTRARGMATILITHDLGLAAAYCDRIAVMEQGRIVETAPAGEIFRAPRQAYTRKLMRATPRPGVGIRDLLPEAQELSVDAGRGARHNVPSPLRGGTGCGDSRTSDVGVTPTPNPSPQGGGESGCTRGEGSASSAAGRQWSAILEVEDLVKEFPLAQSAGRSRLGRRGGAARTFRAVDGISFKVHAGECVGLVGESGCGKSTTSAIVMRLIDPTAGRVVFEGRDIARTPAKAFAADPARARLQMVFQDPTDSLNPRFTAFRAIADPLYRLGNVTRRDEARDRAEALARQVGLPVDLLDRFPHQLSGGQKARVGIARAIALSPRMLILDEPTAALDVSVQAVVLNLLVDLRAELGMSYLFVSHDLNVVRLLCDRVIVMKAGRIVEEGTTDAVLEAPREAYTRELLAAAPRPPV